MVENEKPMQLCLLL